MLRQGEVHVEGILVATQDAGAVVGAVLRHMCQHRIILLQLTCTTGEVRHGTHDGFEGLGLHFLCGRRWRHDGHDGLFLGRQHLGRTPRNVHHEIQRRLRHTEKFLFMTQQLSAVNTFKTVEAGIADGCTDQSLEVEEATQGP